MDHQVFVPAPAEAVRRVLRDPARLARCVQGFQQDTQATGATGDTSGPLSGRLRVRAGRHTITYRGALTTAADEEGFTFRGEGTEVRGQGSVAVALTIRPTAVDGGTNLGINGSATVGGRLADLAPELRAQTAHRLLDRFGERLADVALEPSGPVGGPPCDTPSPTGAGPDDTFAHGREEPHTMDGNPHANRPDENDDENENENENGNGNGSDDGSGSGNEENGSGAGSEDDGRMDGEAARGGRGGAEEDSPVSPGADPEDAADAGSTGDTGGGREAAASTPDADADASRDGRSSDDDRVFDALRDLSGTGELRDLGDLGDLGGLDDLPALGDEPPVEAAHARRTMIGRSAEEVDHAPPRGRYAPVPAPDEGRRGLPLHWIAPAAAALAIASVVVGRALRRRRT
ncbi:SRPBCC family protein [Streptomyces clavuligerus]|uniref:Carbon monoxide dehydrogenase subunit G n=1 Tax=Streptomyces clavuligerus TaxID=1901 RepID=B5GTD0_STRCL|nr:SRPBCC family protein [Streptomyces clavuligerus]ANW19476.1 hypothetical protein BB341_15250 [Streptomyces clavuligerus]AXU14084.1 hypothetical protein D1794_15900 [Streptomyces clavuligerus]EDY49611.1 conserved hypothetical protein [Streptomyces clavuligerus]EFG07723.1 Hypothetical protein SCLAV_2651 [Streptomyces clavuligerus]MBY6304069.1 hypothetical protein [Streptomyces clavuligerus]